MQENQNNNLTEKEASIGALLLSARKHISLSQANVADQINLSLDAVKSLEADDYEKLPSSAYVRGYLRNYARVVGIDAESLVASYNKQHPVDEELNKLSKSSKSYDPVILWSTAAMFSILFGLLYTWWVDDRKISADSFELRPNSSVIAVEAETKANNSESIAVISASPQNEQGINNESIQEVESVDLVENTSAETQVLLENTITADVEQAMEDESMNPNLVSISTGADVLTVTYVEKSWTEIRDADSNPLMQGLIEPGVVRNLSGKAPFSIFLGNSPGVVIEVNGQYFDQSQYLKSNRTARFEVSSSTFN